MKIFKGTFLSTLISPFLRLAPPAFGQTSRWSEQKANDWYARQPWLVGSNYIPKDAINELEMWQAATFDPDEIDKELGWAEGMGMNTMRVFLHDLLWQQDAGGFQKRLDQFLTIAARHHIRPLLVLFDSCWDPLPQLGTAASADSGRTQLGMGAESGGQGVGRSNPGTAAESLCPGRGGSVCEGRSHPRLGRVERTGIGHYWQLSED